MFLATCGLEHEKLMNPEEDTFVTYRRRKTRYTKEQEFEVIQLEDTNLDMDPTGIHSDRGK